MSNEVLERLVSEALVTGQDVVFHWHGGEPLLAGMDFYERAVSLQRRFASSGQIVTNTIQSNGTLIDRRWVRFFEANSFVVGVSIDGPSDIHDAQRPLKNGAGSFRRALRGVKLLQEAGRQPGVIAVVTQPVADRAGEIFEFFLQHNIRRFELLPCVGVDTATEDLAVSPRDYGELLVEMFELWLECEAQDVHIRIIEQIVNLLLCGSFQLCIFANDCSPFVGIDSNGDVYPCCKFVGYDELHLGNLCLASLKDIVASNQSRHVRAAQNGDRRSCEGCEWFALCKGGCAYHRYALSGDFNSHNRFCESYRQILQHVSRRLSDPEVAVSLERRVAALKAAGSWGDTWDNTYYDRH